VIEAHRALDRIEQDWGVPRVCVPVGVCRTSHAPTVRSWVESNVKELVANNSHNTNRITGH
jgi:hypothetical protein